MKTNIPEPLYTLVPIPDSSPIAQALDMASKLLKQAQSQKDALGHRYVEERIQERMAELHRENAEIFHELCRAITPLLLESFKTEIQLFREALESLQDIYTERASRIALALTKELVGSELHSNEIATRTRALAMLDECQLGETCVELHVASGLYRHLGPSLDVSDSEFDSRGHQVLPVLITEDSSLPEGAMRLVTTWGEIYSSPLERMEQLIASTLDIDHHAQISAYITSKFQTSAHKEHGSDTAQITSSIALASLNEH